MITIGLIRNPLGEHTIVMTENHPTNFPLLRRTTSHRSVFTSQALTPASRAPKHNDTIVPQLHLKVVAATCGATLWGRLFIRGDNAVVSALALMRPPPGSHRRGWKFELESCEGAANLGPPFTVGVGEAIIVVRVWLCGMQGGAFARTRGGTAPGCPGSRP